MNVRGRVNERFEEQLILISVAGLRSDVIFKTAIELLK
ncbi:MAG: hypothetical protein JWQ40_3484 [Segetibacter sp.]|nr:hypothetical protein [Segetibacter sp.]